MKERRIIFKRIVAYLRSLIVKILTIGAKYPLLTLIIGVVFIVMASSSVFFSDRGHRKALERIDTIQAETAIAEGAFEAEKRRRIEVEDIYSTNLAESAKKILDQGAEIVRLTRVVGERQTGERELEIRTERVPCDPETLTCPEVKLKVPKVWIEPEVEIPEIRTALGRRFAMVAQTVTYGFEGTSFEETLDFTPEAVEFQYVEEKPPARRMGFTVAAGLRYGQEFSATATAACVQDCETARASLSVAESGDIGWYVGVQGSGAEKSFLWGRLKAAPGFDVRYGKVGGSWQVDAGLAVRF